MLLSIKTLQTACLFLSFRIQSDFKRHALANARTLTIFGEFRDVNKYLVTACAGLDKAKAAFIVPLCQYAIKPHVTFPPAQSVSIFAQSPPA